MKHKLVRLLPWIGFIAVSLFIFLLSSDTADTSNALSKSVASHILNLLGIDADVYTVASFNHFLRKAAHFSLFLIMGMFVYSISAMNIKHLPLRICLSEAVGVLFAVLDEVHQIFVAGRAAQISDVLIDVCGYTLGAIIVNLAVKTVSYIRRKNLSLKGKAVKPEI